MGGVGDSGGDLGTSVSGGRVHHKLKKHIK
jgi:hypothetical protein